MNKSIAISIVFGISALCAFAEKPAITNRHPNRLTIAERRLRQQQANGGTIISKPKAKVLEILNHQSAIPQNVLQESVERIMRVTGIPIIFADNKSENAGASLEIVVNDTDPTLLSAIDDGWAKANFKKLIDDKPTEERLRQRVNKQLWRAVGASLGIGVSGFQPSIMRNIANVKELDNIPMMQPEPATLNCFDDCPLFFGIEKVRVTTYRKACMEGWAPQPTNDVQKAIWDQVHAIPQSPMKIEFDPKKGR